MKQDTRTLKQVEKAIATLRRKVAQAVKRHEKLQARIFKLEAEGRIVNLSHDADILAGIGCHYVKSDSLNPDPDSLTNWYYEVLFIEEYGVYQCSCDDVRAHDHCKHIRKLAATFAPVEKKAEKRELATAGTLNNANQGFSLYR